MAYEEVVKLSESEVLKLAPPTVLLYRCKVITRDNRRITLNIRSVDPLTYHEIDKLLAIYTDNESDIQVQFPDEDFKPTVRMEVI